MRVTGVQCMCMYTKCLLPASVCGQGQGCVCHVGTHVAEVDICCVSECTFAICVTHTCWVSLWVWSLYTYVEGLLCIAVYVLTSGYRVCISVWLELVCFPGSYMCTCM